MDNAEVDLRPYIVALINRWYIILGGAVVFAILAAIISSFLPKTYTATAAVLMQIRQTGAQLGTNEQLLNIETIDVAARRQGLLSLAESTAIEGQLAPDVLGRIAPPSYRPGMFVGQNMIEVEAQGDLLNISAHLPDATRSKELADAWATTYVEYVNSLYTDQASEVQLVGEALVPFKPSRPAVMRNAVLGAMLGTLLAIGLVLVRTVQSGHATPSRVQAPPEHAIKSPSLTP